MALVLGDGVLYGLDEVVVAGDLRRDDGELTPRVAFQQRQHGAGLVRSRRRQLQHQIAAGPPLSIPEHSQSSDHNRSPRF